MSKITTTEKITSLCRARPCMIITTLHENGIVNAGTFGAYTNVGPQEMGIAIGRRSHTYANIRRTGEFVINVPDISHAKALEVCAQNIPDSQSELDQAGMTTAPAIKINTPIINECISNVECTFWQEVEIGHHVLVLCKVVYGHVDERFIDSDGGLDVIKAEAAFSVRYPEPLYATLGNVRQV